MKKIISSSLLVSFLILSVGIPSIVVADTTGIKEAPEIPLMPTIDTIINIIFTFLLVFAAIMLIMAGFQFMTAGGDSEAVKKARDKVLYAIIGLIVAFLARGLISFIEQMLTSK